METIFHQNEGEEKPQKCRWMEKRQFRYARKIVENVF